MFCAPGGECDRLEAIYGIPAVPYVDPTPNYSRKFQYIMEKLEDEDGKLVILDDDLVFSRRVDKTDGKVGLKSIMDKKDVDYQLPVMFAEIQEHLDHVPQCGVHPRQMGHLAPLPFKRNGKVITVNGLNMRILRDMSFGTGWRVDMVPMLADTFLNCEVLTRFGENRLVTDFCVDWGASQAEGGCDYRTKEMQEECIDALVAAFPNFVSKVIKRPKVAKWLGDERVDYRAAWKRMAEDGARRAATSPVPRGL